MYRIAKEFQFSASHNLTTLEDGHPCKRVHGHNYVVTVELSAAELNEHGFVREYRDLDLLKNYIDECFDHRHLNDVLARPTSEVLAKHFFDWCKEYWPEICAVRIAETPKIWAEYRP